MDRHLWWNAERSSPRRTSHWSSPCSMPMKGRVCSRYDSSSCQRPSRHAAATPHDARCGLSASVICIQGHFTCHCYISSARLHSTPAQDSPIQSTRHALTRDPMWEAQWNWLLRCCKFYLTGNMLHIEGLLQHDHQVSSSETGTAPPCASRLRLRRGEMRKRKKKRRNSTCAPAGPSINFGQQRLQMAQLQQAVQVAAPRHTQVAVLEAAAQALPLRAGPAAMPCALRPAVSRGRRAVRLVLQRLFVQCQCS